MHAICSKLLGVTTLTLVNHLLILTYCNTVPTKRPKVNRIYRRKIGTREWYVPKGENQFGKGVLLKIENVPYIFS